MYTIKITFIHQQYAYILMFEGYGYGA
jgi:hypothetical protein